MWERARKKEVDSQVRHNLLRQQMDPMAAARIGGFLPVGQHDYPATRAPQLQVPQGGGGGGGGGRGGGGGKGGGKKPQHSLTEPQASDCARLKRSTRQYQFNGECYVCKLHGESNKHARWECDLWPDSPRNLYASGQVDEWGKPRVSVPQGTTQQMAAGLAALSQAASLPPEARP